MVTISQEHEPRARDLEAKKDREHERAVLVNNEGDLRDGRSKPL